VKDDFQKYALRDSGEKTLQKGTWSRVTCRAISADQDRIKAWNAGRQRLFIRPAKTSDGATLNTHICIRSAGLYAMSRAFSIGPGFDYTSGTATGSAKNHTFDPLYGTPHKFWGQMDYFYAANGFGKGGLSDLYINTTIKASEKLSINTDLHHFASAAQVRVADNRKLSSSFGEELDIIANYNLTKTISFQGGYCTFFSTNSLAQVKGVKSPQKMSNWAYLMINIKPEFLK
jgi:hypothetical protein